MKGNTKGKEKLIRMKKISGMIKTLREQEKLERATLTDTSIKYNEIQVKSSGAKDLIGEKAPDIVMLIEKIEEYCEELAREKAECLTIVKTMKFEWQQAIIYYYFQDLTLEKAAEKMNISYVWLSKYLRDAEEDFEKKYDETL